MVLLLGFRLKYHVFLHLSILTRVLVGAIWMFFVGFNHLGKPPEYRQGRARRKTTQSQR